MQPFKSRLVMVTACNQSRIACYKNLNGPGCAIPPQSSHICYAPIGLNKNLERISQRETAEVFAAAAAGKLIGGPDRFDQWVRFMEITLLRPRPRHLAQ